MSSMTIIKRFWQYIKPFRLVMLLSLIAGTIGGAATVYLTYLTGRAIDKMHVHHVLFGTLIPLLSWFVLLIIITTFTQWLVQKLSYQLSYQSVALIRQEAIQHLNQLSVRDFDQFNHGDIISRFTNDLDNVSVACQQLFTTLFTGITTVVMALVFMLYLSIPLTLVILVTTPLVFLFTYIVAQRGQHYFKEQQEILGELSSFSDEAIHEQEIIQLFAQQENVQNKFTALNQSLYQVGQKAQFISSLTNPLSRFVDHLAYAGIGLVGGLILYKASGSVPVGLISSFTLYSSQFSKPFIEISGITTQIQTALAGLERIFTLMDQPSEAPDSPEAITLTHPCGKIDFNHVTFGYTPEKTVIHQFDLHIQPGQTIAIIGKTGAGKSTLINLLLRFYEVNSGSICVDDHPIQQITRSSLRSAFGMVLQETWLFHGTIRENLLLDQPQTSDEEMIAAAKMANAHSFIQRLPKQYDTVIDENTSLSEGEKQLLAIARTFISNPKILILDEATSSLDTLTEQHVQEAFLRLMEGRTSLVIAHRLSTIQRSDCILVVEDGAIIEQGTHDELIQQPQSHYYQLYHSQFH